MLQTENEYAAEQEGSYYLVRIPAGQRGLQPRRIDFSPVPGVTIPPDYSALFVDVERTLTVLNILFPDDEKKASVFDQSGRNEIKFKEYYRKLADLSLTALGQDQVQLGRMALAGLQDEIVAREAGFVKNSYIRRLGSYALALGAVGAVFYLLFRYGYPSSDISRLREFITLVVGSLLGTWLSFSMRRVSLGFWDLAHLEEDRLDPGIRLLFVAGLTLVIGLLLSTKAVRVVIGEFNTDFLQSGTTAFLIGCLCGISEKSLSTAIGRRASDFIASLGGSGRSSISSNGTISFSGRPTAGSGGRASGVQPSSPAKRNRIRANSSRVMRGKSRSSKR